MSDNTTLNPVSIPTPTTGTQGFSFGQMSNEFKINYITDYVQLINAKQSIYSMFGAGPFNFDGSETNKIPRIKITGGLGQYVNQVGVNPLYPDGGSYLDSPAINKSGFITDYQEFKLRCHRSAYTEWVKENLNMTGFANSIIGRYIELFTRTQTVVERDNITTMTAANASDRTYKVNLEPYFMPKESAGTLAPNLTYLKTQNFDVNSTTAPTTGFGPNEKVASICSQEFGLTPASGKTIYDYMTHDAIFSFINGITAYHNSLDLPTPTGERYLFIDATYEYTINESLRKAGNEAVRLNVEVEVEGLKTSDGLKLGIQVMKFNGVNIVYVPSTRLNRFTSLGRGFKAMTPVGETKAPKVIMLYLEDTDAVNNYLKIENTVFYESSPIAEKIGKGEWSTELKYDSLSMDEKHYKVCVIREYFPDATTNADEIVYNEEARNLILGAKDLVVQVAAGSPINATVLTAIQGLFTGTILDTAKATIVSPDQNMGAIPAGATVYAAVQLDCPVVAAKKVAAPFVGIAPLTVYVQLSN